MYGVPTTARKPIKHPGFSRVGKACTRIPGLSGKIQDCSWSRALLGVRRGEYDAALGAYRNDAPDFIFPSIAQTQGINCFYKQIESVDIPRN